ncbi:MAG: MoxR family ATPase [Planctomycetota bacterium]
MELESITVAASRLREQVGRVVIGQDRVVDLMLTALLAEGHVLLEGVPGTAKTLLARTFACCLDLDFSRIQFTPDLMPGDVLGTNLYDFKTATFTLTKGPIFTQLLLADEINRTAPKTQAALLEAMQERSVTLDGTRHELGAGFLVVATQNPIEQEGTYPLPEAQLDRFLFKVDVDYPSRDAERAMVATHGQRTAMPHLDDFGLETVADLATLEAARATVRQLRLSDEMIDYIVDIVRATRDDAALLCGASPRAANMLASASRAWAAMQGREFVIPDDVKELALPTLAHRVVMAPGSEIDGHRARDVIRAVLDQVPAPR